MEAYTQLSLDMGCIPPDILHLTRDIEPTLHTPGLIRSLWSNLESWFVMYNHLELTRSMAGQTMYFLWV